MTEVDHLADEAIIAIVPARGDGLAVFSYVRSRDGEWAATAGDPSSVRASCLAMTVEVSVTIGYGALGDSPRFG